MEVFCDEVTFQKYRKHEYRLLGWFLWPDSAKLGPIDSYSLSAHFPDPQTPKSNFPRQTKNMLFVGGSFSKPNPPEAAGDETLAFKENQGPFWRYSVMKRLFKKSQNRGTRLSKSFPWQDSAKLAPIDSYCVSAYFPDPRPPKMTLFKSKKKCFRWLPYLFWISLSLKLGTEEQVGSNASIWIEAQAVPFHSELEWEMHPCGDRLR